MNSAEDSSNLKALLVLAFGAFCISFAAIFVKLLGRDVLGPTAIGFWRTIFGAGILFVWVVLKGESLKIPPIIAGFAALAGFIFFLDLFFWHRSIIFAGAGMATILANTQVFFVALLGLILFRERLNLPFAMAVVAAFVGVVLLVGIGSDVDFSTIYLQGIVFGLLTGLVYGCYIVTLKKAGHRGECPSFLVVMAWTSLFTAIFCGISMLIESDPYLPPDLFSVFILFSLALVAQAVGWYVISTTLPELRAAQSALILLLQPVLATVWGVLFFAEHLTLLQVIGAVITLVSIYVGSARKKRVNY
ncbi:MAG: DMT family transporter [Candidatus Zixiibacteriota bacterium]|nr:MAG: DMT family transporter [candidate division Zixibacteria bacterium]